MEEEKAMGGDCAGCGGSHEGEEAKCVKCGTDVTEETGVCSGGQCFCKMCAPKPEDESEDM
ncbi:hypothetical protein KJ855_02965 [Patescibacteria group bacterium]|nr:hypothetical protein [Patescibacteria group bacterium]